MFISLIKRVYEQKLSSNNHESKTYFINKRLTTKSNLKEKKKDGKARNCEVLLNRTVEKI